MNPVNRRLSPFGAVVPFLRTGTCSQALFGTINRAYGCPMPVEEHASALLAGGLMMQGYQCGQIWGAALAAGARAYRLYGTGADAQAGAIAAARGAIDAFRSCSEHVDCSDIIDLHAKPSKKDIVRMMLKGTYARCMGLAARYPRLAMRAIDGALSAPSVAMPAGPASCAALVAQRMGASEARTVIAAGLAGGIGLSGGACGALAGAVWLTVLRKLENGDAKIGFHDPDAAAMLERFLKSANYELECSAIVGRTFDGIADHARHVCQGGCAKILDALAAAS